MEPTGIEPAVPGMNSEHSTSELRSLKSNWLDLIEAILRKCTNYFKKESNKLRKTVDWNIIYFFLSTKNTFKLFTKYKFELVTF